MWLQAIRPAMILSDAFVWPQLVDAANHDPFTPPIDCHLLHSHTQFEYGLIWSCRSAGNCVGSIALQVVTCNHRRCRTERRPKRNNSLLYGVIYMRAVGCLWWRLPSSSDSLVEVLLEHVSGRLYNRTEISFVVYHFQSKSQTELASDASWFFLIPFSSRFLLRNLTAAVLLAQPSLTN